MAKASTQPAPQLYVVAQRTERFTYREGPNDPMPILMDVRNTFLNGELDPLRDWLREGIELVQQVADDEDDEAAGDEDADGAEDGVQAVSVEPPAPRSNADIYPLLAPWVTWWNLAELVDGEVVAVPPPAVAGPEVFDRLPDEVFNGLFWFVFSAPARRVDAARKRFSASVPTAAPSPDTTSPSETATTTSESD